MENQNQNKNRLVLWSLFFITYVFGHLGFSAYFETQKGYIFTISNFFLEYLTQGLFFPLVVIAIAAHLSVQAMFKSSSKIITLILIATIVSIAYRSLSFFMYFLVIEKVLVVLILFILAAFFGYVFKFVKPITSTILISLIMIIVVTSGLYLGFTIPRTLTADTCNNFTEKDQKNYCFYEVGIKNLDLDSCLKVPSGGTSHAGPQCAREILVQLEKESKLTTSQCDTYKNLESKSVCYYRIATVTNDKTLCENVVDLYTDSAMALPINKSLDKHPAMEIPDKKTCLSKTAN